MDYRTIAVVTSAVTALVAGPTCAQEDDNEYEFSFNGRVRIEGVEENNALRDATSATARIRAGLSTPSFGGWSGIAEIEAIENVAGDDFNSGSNGRADFSVVLDHEDVEVNQLAVGYRDNQHDLQLGRQRMVFDNARHFGDVAYRQNQQTFDALRYVNTSLAGQRFAYAYMTRARRFLGDENPVGEIDMNSHLFNYRLQRLSGDVFSAYAYLVDMDTAAVRQNSIKTFGLRYVGSYATQAGDLLYTLEYANQSDFGDGLATNDADYVLAEAGIKLKNEWVAKLGQERLHGDGVYGFQTPFGTNHAFNGLADLFAARTPADGLIDTYANVTAPLLGARVRLAAHHFTADRGGRDYGTELDFTLEKRFAEHFALNLLFADYRADGFGVDTTKWVVWLDVRY